MKEIVRNLEHRFIRMNYAGERKHRMELALELRPSFDLAQNLGVHNWSTLCRAKNLYFSVKDLTWTGIWTLHNCFCRSQHLWDILGFHTTDSDSRGGGDDECLLRSMLENSVIRGPVTSGKPLLRHLREDHSFTSVVRRKDDPNGPGWGMVAQVPEGFLLCLHSFWGTSPVGWCRGICEVKPVEATTLLPPTRFVTEARTFSLFFSILI